MEKEKDRIRKENQERIRNGQALSLSKNNVMKAALELHLFLRCSASSNKYLAEYERGDITVQINDHIDAAMVSYVGTSDKEYKKHKTKRKKFDNLIKLYIEQKLPYTEMFKKIEDSGIIGKLNHLTGTHILIRKLNASFYYQEISIRKRYDLEAFIKFDSTIDDYQVFNGIHEPISKQNFFYPKLKDINFVLRTLHRYEYDSINRTTEDKSTE